MNKLEKLHELGQKLLAVEREEDVPKVGVEVEAEIHDLIKSRLYQFIEFKVDRVMDQKTGEFLHFQAASKPEMIDILGGSIVIADAGKTEEDLRAKLIEEVEFHFGDEPEEGETWPEWFINGDWDVVW